MCAKMNHLELIIGSNEQLQEENNLETPGKEPLDAFMDPTIYYLQFIPGHQLPHKNRHPKLPFTAKLSQGGCAYTSNLSIEWPA